MSKGDRGRVLPNPFFAALLLASTVFVVTCFAYLIGPYLLERAAKRPERAGSLGFAAWLDRRGPLAIGVEFVVMLLLAGSAMILDDRFPKKRKAVVPTPPPDSGPAEPKEPAA